MKQYSLKKFSTTDTKLPTTLYIGFYITATVVTNLHNTYNLRILAVAILWNFFVKYPKGLIIDDTFCAASNDHQSDTSVDMER